MRHNNSRAALFVLAGLTVWFVFGLVAQADTVFLKGGQKLEGKIITEKPDYVEIKTRFGTVKIERERIEKIVFSQTKEEEYCKRFAKIDKNDPDALFELAGWCQENKLKKEYRELIKMTLAADPQHDGANKELGKTKYNGKWFTPSELNEYKQNEAERMKAQGMVFYEGIWMPEVEARKRMGYQEFEGEWISLMEYYHRTSERDIPKIFGDALTITDSKHFTIRSRNPEPTHLELLDYCELEYEHFMIKMTPDPVEDRMISYYPVPIYILDDVDACDLFIDSGYIKRYNPPAVLDRYAHSTNFSIYFPRPLIVLTMGRHLVGSEDKLTAQIGFMSHHVGHILIRRFKCGGSVPGWIETGFAHYYEGLTNFHQTISVCEYKGYEEIVKWTAKWENFHQWRKQLINPATHGNLPTIRELFNLQIETCTSRDMAKSWSVVTYLIKNHPESFVIYVRRALAPYRGERKLSNDKAWKLGFDSITPEEMEKRWRAWIVQQPPVPQREDRLALPTDEDE